MPIFSQEGNRCLITDAIYFDEGFIKISKIFSRETAFTKQLYSGLGVYLLDW